MSAVRVNSMTDAAMLSVDRLSSGYGRSQVLFGLSLKVPANGAVAILGRNGVGKTTLLKTLAGEIRPMGGTIAFDGRDATAEPTESRVRRGMGYVPQEQAIFGKLTVRENLLLGAIRQTDKSGIAQVLDLFPKLGQRLGQTAGTLSGGERKMLAIGRALLGRPKVLLLDEPTEGVWIGVIEEISQRLRRLAQEMALVLVEQHIELALDVAHYAYVMDRGQVALEGPAADIRSDPRLLRYLSP
jgi:branched-chain amino acid transport system ATP-binding protein